MKPTVRALGAVVAACLVAAVSLVLVAAVPAAPSGPAARAKGPTSGTGRHRLGRELQELRTRNSRTYLTTGGARVARTFATPVNYKDSNGDWRAIDDTLVPASAGAVRNAADQYGAELPSDISEPVRFTEGGAWVEFSLAGASGTGTQTGNRKQYANALSGVDAAYAAQPTGLKETLTLANRDARNAFSYKVAASDGLTAHEDGHGGIAFVDAAGKTRLAFTAPYAFDAHGARASGSAAPRLALDRRSSGDTVSMAVGRSWLDAKDRAFPVTVDPTVTWNFNKIVNFDGTSQECTLWSGASANTSFCGGSTTSEGFDGTKKARGLYKFDLSSIPRDGMVLDSSFWLYFESASSTWSTKAEVHRVDHSWTTGASWNDYDGSHAWSSAGGDFASDAIDTEWVDGDSPYFAYFQHLGDTVQNWVDGTDPNNGLLVKQVGDESGPQVVNFTSTAGDPTGAHIPELDVTYWPRAGTEGQYTFDSQKLNDRSNLSVNVGNGNLMVTADDLHVAGTNGMDFDLSRTYNSGWTDFWKDMSHGWQTNVGTGTELIDTDSGDVIYSGPSGDEVLFKHQSGDSYKTPSNLNADLESGSFTAGGVTYPRRLTFHKSNMKLYFDGNGLLQRQEDRNGNAITTDYAPISWYSPSAFHDTRGRTYSVSHNGNGQISEVSDPAGSRNVQYGYDSGWDLTSFTDANAKVTQYGYDWDSGLLNKITDPRGNVTVIAYDSSNRVTSVMRVTGQDGSGNDTGPTTTYSYPGVDTTVCPSSAWGQTNVTDPNGHVTKYCYDKSLQVTRVKDARGETRNQQYSPNGDVTQLTTAGQQSFNFTFDSDNRQKDSTQPAKTSGGTGLTSSLGYDSTVTGKTDPRYWLPTTDKDTQGNQLTYGYDSKGNMTSVQDQLSQQKQLNIHRRSDGQIDWIKQPTDESKPDTDPTTSLSYNSSGELSSIDRPTPLGDESFTYDSDSRPDVLTDGKGHTADYDFDKMDRITKIAYDDGSTVLFGYDDNGNLTSRTDATGQTTYTYDKLNRLSTENFPGSRQNTYSYDAIGNLKTFADASGTTTYTYGPSNLLDSMQAPGDSAAVTFGYDDDGRRTTTTYPTTGTAKVKMTAHYDNPGRLTEIKGEKVDPSTGNILATLSDLTYDYSTVPTTCGGGSAAETNLRQTVTDHVSSPNKVTTYCYDSLNRLTKAVESPGSSYAYNYDGDSNLTSKTKDSTTTSYGFNRANEMCWSVGGTQASSACTPTPSGATTYSYDPAGNMTGSGGTGGGFVGQYNAKEQTTSMTGLTGGSATSLTYAGPNQYERATVGSTTQTTSALGVNVDKTSTSSTYYRRDNQGQLVSQRLPSGAIDYYLFDGLGSVTALADTTGAKAQSYSYDPYGATTVNNGAGPANPWRYAATYQDPTGFYKMGARYYAPALQRWTQQDPVNSATDVQQLNRYAYAGADPVNFTDLAGTSIFSDAWDTVSSGATTAWNGVKSGVSSGASFLASNGQRLLRTGAQVTYLYASASLTVDACVAQPELCPAAMAGAAAGDKAVEATGIFKGSYLEGDD